MKKFLTIALFCAVFISSTPYAQQQMLADRHMAGTQNCAMCHDATPTAGAQVSTAKCNSCHGSLEAVSQINRAKPNAQNPNPHINHSIGLNCNECHQAHQPSQNMCANCHNFQYQVP